MSLQKIQLKIWKKQSHKDQKQNVISEPNSVLKRLFHAILFLLHF